MIIRCSHTNGLFACCACVAEATLKSVLGTMKSYKQLRRERAERKRSMRVEYTTTHHDNKPCEREIVVPEGYIMVHRIDVTEGDMVNHDGSWIQIDASQVDTVRHRHIYATGRIYIRPIKRIALEAYGWYSIEGVDGIHQATLTLFGRLLEINGHLYDPTGLPDARCAASPRILKRVYLSDAPIERKGWCSGMGQPEPQPIHIKLGPDASSGERFQQAVKEAQDLMDRIDEPMKSALVEALLNAGSIVPKQPFRLTGPGWYAVAHKDAWLKICRLELTMYNDDGTRRDGQNDMALVERATPAQEKILEGL